MKKIFVYMVYEVMKLKIMELLDSEIDMVTQEKIQEIAIETFIKLGLALFLGPEQIGLCCTCWIGYTLEEFVEAVMRSISEEDNELFNRVEQIAILFP